MLRHCIFMSFLFFRVWSENYCTSPLCARSAQNLIATMNASADPCVDFYNFACGNFAPQYKPSWIQPDRFTIGIDLLLKNISTYLKMNGSDSDPKSVIQARILYKQCLGITDREEKNFDPISSVLKDVGLPVLPPLQGASSNFSLLYSMYDEQSRGSRTLNENIADNGGLRNAFYAYRNYVLKYGSEPSLPELKNYTSEQLFFLSYANLFCKADSEWDSYSKSTDEHSPKHVRVWGTLTSSKEFAEAWKCKRGTPMNPAESKCEIW